MTGHRQLDGWRQHWRLSRRALPAVALAATVLAVAACNKTPQYAVTGSIPGDYRERHPIRLTENDHTVHLLVGTGTGVLTAEQRAQVAFMASTWRQEGTGHLLVETPKGTANARTAAYAAREAQSILRASGVPPRAIIAKSYSAEPSALGPVRLGYLRIEAEVGPCGLWPEDLGASLYPSLTRVHPNIENQRPDGNHGSGLWPLGERLHLNALSHEGFDRVTGLDVVIVLDADTG